MAKQKSTKKSKKEQLVIEVNKDSALRPDKFHIKDNSISDWFNNIHTGIKTPISKKSNLPKGNWSKCNKCGRIMSIEEMEPTFFVCSHCDHHHRISSELYMNMLFDDQKYTTLFSKIRPVDILKFSDTRSYKSRLEEAQKNTKLSDAIRVAVGNIKKYKAVIAGMDFSFIGGSLGSVVGEKFCRGVEYAIKKKIPFISICQSGGARMMESAFSLMQMPKTLASLHLLAEAHLPYIVILTDPTYGGVTASFGMVGDIHIAEPKARIGFAGKRIIEDLMKQKLPANFQTSESLLQNGFIDRIVHRHQLKDELATIFKLLKS